MKRNGITSHRCPVSSFILRRMTLSVFVVLLVLLHKEQQQCFAWIATTRLSSLLTKSTTGITNLYSTKMYIDNANIQKKQSSTCIVPSQRRHQPLVQQETTITVSNYHPTRQHLPQLKHHHSSKINHTNVVMSTHGMPWKKSISEQYNMDHPATTNGLLYMKFYEWQISYMKQALTNLKEIPLFSKKGQMDMSYVQNQNATMRMHTSAYTSEEYKYIRCTTVDGGNQIQVFTSLFYPRNTLLPVLGIDLLQFNHGKKTLCIVDFQPVLTPEDETTTTLNNNNKFSSTSSEYYESKLKLIRDQYPSLQNEMTNRFYSSEDPYFSKQMLLGRVQHVDSKMSRTIEETKAATYNMVHNDLYPAYQQYVQTHVQLQKEALQEQQQKSDIVVDESLVQECHAKYDTYSAERDPAHKLLGNIFGHDFANDYVYDILFPSATRNI